MTNRKTSSDAKMVAYAIDFSAAASISSLKYWLDTLRELGPKLDCFDKAIHIFNDTNIHIPTQAKIHYGEAIKTSQFTNEYIMEKINKWVE